MSACQTPIDSPEREALFGRAILALATVTNDSSTDVSESIRAFVTVAASTIAAYSNHTLKLLSNPSLDSASLKIAKTGIISQWDDQQVSDFLSNSELLKELTSISNGLSMMESYLKMLSYYEELSPLGSPERARQTAAILTFAMYAHKNASLEDRKGMVLNVKGSIREFTLPYINDRKLRELLISSERAQEAVMDIVTQRSIFKAEHILALLDIESAPLASGNL